MTGGTIIGSSHKTKVVVKMPALVKLVTISVTVTTSGGMCPGFATVSLKPLTHHTYNWLQALCHLRHLVIVAMGSKRGVVGVRDKVPVFVDPLWDPIRGEYQLPSPAELRALREQATEFIKLIDREIAGEGTKT